MTKKCQKVHCTPRSIRMGWTPSGTPFLRGSKAWDWWFWVKMTPFGGPKWPLFEGSKGLRLMIWLKKGCFRSDQIWRSRVTGSGEPRSIRSTGPRSSDRTSMTRFGDQKWPISWTPHFTKPRWFYQVWCAQHTFCVLNTSYVSSHYVTFVTLFASFWWYAWFH